METTDNWISIETIIKYILLICFGFGISQIFFNNKVEQKETKDEISKEVRLQEQYKYINPLLECSDNIGGIYVPDKLKADIENYIKEKEQSKELTQISVYFRDLNNGPWFGINEKEYFTPASLTKVPMLMLYYKKAETDPNILNTKLRITKENFKYYENQITLPQEKLQIEKEYTINELIEHMIYYSDNVAYIALKNNLKQYEFNKLFLDFGIDISTRAIESKEDLLSVREYASFFRILYNASYLNREYSEKALAILANTKYDKGIVKGINDPNTLIAHKFGEREFANQDQLHDCGIIYKSNNPYLLCIMTRGNDMNKLPTIISDVTRIINNYR